MRRVLVLFSVVGLSMFAVAQIPIPGTFSTLPAQTGKSIYAPLLSPPSVTLSNGLTPGVVTSETSYFVTTPQNMPLVPSLVNVPADSGPLPAMAPDEDIASAAHSTIDTPSLRRFDFIVAGDGPSVYNTDFSDSRSLAEVAADVRRTAVQPHHLYTNDDIARINRKYGSAKTTAKPTLDAFSDN